MLVRGPITRWRECRCKPPTSLPSSTRSRSRAIFRFFAATLLAHRTEKMRPFTFTTAAMLCQSTLETGEDTTLLAERERVMGRPIQSRSSATVVCCKLTICYATLRRGCRACCSSDHREEPPRRPASAMADACQPPSRKLNWTPSFAARAWSYYHRSPTPTVIAANHGRSSIVAV